MERRLAILKIRIPSACLEEQYYVLKIILADFLGVEYQVEIFNESYVEIESLEDSRNCGVLSISAPFFLEAERSWLLPESMPAHPLAQWRPADDGIAANLVESRVPILFGQPGLAVSKKRLHLNLDIFGSCFFMLSRYEEMIVVDLDEHNRFPATASVAYKEGFLSRPLVNEYVEILWECLLKISPQAQRRERTFTKHISCDVDHPLDIVGYSLRRTALRVAARLLRDKRPKIAVLDFLNYCFKKVGSDIFDDYRNNIFRIMQMNGEVGNCVEFYFIPVQTDPLLEDPNDIRNRKVLDLIKNIISSGHKVGIHPGYKTYNNSAEFRRSCAAFREAMHLANIPVEGISGRQHYLMYDISKTPHLWEENGLRLDSTLGFADKAGFRCGVCYEYQMYDLVRRRSLKLIQRPLVLMETTLLSYEDLKQSDGSLAGRIEYFERVIKQYQGDFTLLWHNSGLPDNSVYKAAIG